MPELLAPAGSIEALDAAVAQGADSVYVGLKDFNARLRAGNFTYSQFEAAAESLHRMNKRIYAALNTVFQENECETFWRMLSFVQRAGADGVIVQDLGAVRMCQEFFPRLRVHASTQMNVASANAANLLGSAGVKRVVLSRELSAAEIRDVRAGCNLELEVFVHGSLCASESGLCLFSSFLGGKSANRGLCAQACRRRYTAELPGGDESGYYFSPCDLQLVERVSDLEEAGVNCFKIEGRMKSAEYVGAVVAAYRFAIDNWRQDKRGALAEAKRILAGDFARAKSEYWWGFETPQEGTQSAGDAVLEPTQAGGTGIYLGKIQRLRKATPEEQAAYQRAAGTGDAICMAVFSGGYEVDIGDTVRFHRRDDSKRESHKVRLAVREGDALWVSAPASFKTGDDAYLLQVKAASRRYKKVLPADLSPYRMRPTNDLLPVMDLTRIQKGSLSWFPKGLYVQVSTAADACAVAAMRPVRVIVELNFQSADELLHKDDPQKPLLPFPKKMMVLSLDPFVPQGREEELSNTIRALFDKGWHTFIANNLSHVKLLQKLGANIIAGPYLYVFNRWAASFLENQGVMVFSSPIENSRKNLESVFCTKEERDRVLLCIFAYPTLFRMRFKLPESYDFTYFWDKTDTAFKVNSTPDGSFVTPEQPFSLLDMAQELATKGWTRQLVDFSKTRVAKVDVRGAIQAIKKKTPVPNTSRFNWKEGFFDPTKQLRMQGAHPTPSQQS